MGRLVISNRKYLYITSGTGLSPNINGLRFYDSNLRYASAPSYYSEDGQYAIWRRMIGQFGVWIIGSANSIGTIPSSPHWGKVSITLVNNDYPPMNGASGTLAISEYKNKISINKQNTGGGTINAYKINDYIFSYNSAINFNTSCSDENGDYYATQADPYQISFNVNLPKKPKQVQVKLKSVSADDIKYMGIVLTNPDNKPCFINQYNPYNDYNQDRRLTTVSSVNALVTDNAQDGLFQTGIGGLLSNDITGRPYTITGSLAFTCKADHFFTGYIRVEGCQTAEMGASGPYCGSPPNIISGFLPKVDGLTGVGSSSIRFYYTKLNKLIDNNYNGTWKISSWNYWNNDPSDLQNYINNGIDLIFKF
jgi:hypothetical protein